MNSISFLFLICCIISIAELLIERNKLNGPVPDSICTLRENLDDQFKALRADCLANSDGIVQNPCDCCSECFAGKGLD